jgi:hypothetical protein
MDEQSDGRDAPSWTDWLRLIEAGDLREARRIRGMIPDRPIQPREDPEEARRPVRAPGTRRKDRKP